MQQISTVVGSGMARTIGLDVADKSSTYVGLNQEGQVVCTGKVATQPAAIERQFGRLTPCRIALEAGTHSAWLSRTLYGLGHEVIVANPRQIPLIFRSTKKNDREDAEGLARLARLDPKLLRPLEHRGAQAQADLALLRARDALVRHRSALISAARGLVKSLGDRIPQCSAEAFPDKARQCLSEEALRVVGPLLDGTTGLTAQVRRYDKEVAELGAERYPQTTVLRQVNGVGPLTSLAFVLCIEDPWRFQRSRQVGCYVGLTPRQHESGESKPQLRITKAGDELLRRLLVQSAHYILGPFGLECELRAWGLKLAAQGRQGKKRAVVAVARKLAVLLHRLWLGGEVYDPHYQAHQRAQKAAA